MCCIVQSHATSPCVQVHAHGSAATQVSMVCCLVSRRLLSHVPAFWIAFAYACAMLELVDLCLCAVT